MHNKYYDVQLFVGSHVKFNHLATMTSRSPTNMILPGVVELSKSWSIAYHKLSNQGPLLKIHLHLQNDGNAMLLVEKYNVVMCVIINYCDIIINMVIMI